MPRTARTIGGKASINCWVISTPPASTPENFMMLTTRSQSRLTDQIEERPSHQRIQSGCWLVQNEYIGGKHQSLNNADFLTVAQTHVFDFPVQIQIKPFWQFLNAS